MSSFKSYSFCISTLIQKLEMQTLVFRNYYWTRQFSIRSNGRKRLELEVPTIGQHTLKLDLLPCPPMTSIHE